MESAAELESQLVESITSARTIKSFGLENYANVRTEVRFISLLERVYVSARNSIFSGSATEFSSRLFTIILLWVGTGYVLQTEISPGELLSFYALIGYFTGPVSNLIGANKTVQNAMIAADRLFEIMDLETDESTDKIKLESNHLPGDIKLSGVSFRYGSRKDVFEDFDLVIPKGKVTALIGESGSGKTTLISLLQNLYPIQKGKILYGDYDIKYIHPDSLQSVMAIVPQKVDLFSGNVLENIAIGDFSPDMSRVLDICKQLNILEFIESLPSGFQTYLGENGASLSGGQKQRLAIARALYREPDLLILDEATSALDAASEEYVMNTIQWMKEINKTVLLITHRLATALRADKIVVLDNGTVEEEGSYSELMAAKGKYYQLWRKQLPVEFQSLLQ